MKGLVIVSVVLWCIALLALWDVRRHTKRIQQAFENLNAALDPTSRRVYPIVRSVHSKIAGRDADGRRGGR
ncbi:MAG TPA: hypothetical protein VK864_18770 [Longimicrobiales bacterium]|nr:hypothetical protein [Longimicrobiales bacterium]